MRGDTTLLYTIHCVYGMKAKMSIAGMLQQGKISRLILDLSVGMLRQAIQQLIPCDYSDIALAGKVVFLHPIRQ